MSITLSALQKQRRDTAANWTAANPTLLAGEIGIESDTGYWKVGDGSTVWNSLAYLSGLGSTIAVNKGGTGQTSYTNGQLLIGNTTGNTLTKSTLTAGSGVTITNGNGSISISATGSGGTVTSVSGTAPISVATGTTTPAISVSSASTSAAGVVQLSDSTSTTSSVLAATSTAVKSAYDLANAALPKAGGTVTGNINLDTGVSLVFEGTTADPHEITLTVVDPTADRTLYLPNIDGTLISSGDTGTVTSTMLLDGTILNADVNASAAIVDTKLATISTAGKVSNSATTATNANTASAIVARDASGNFSAGTITAALTGNATTATTLATARNIQGVSFDGSAAITVVTAGSGISVTGTAVANTGVLSVNSSTGAITNVAKTDTAQSFTAAQRGTVSALGSVSAGTTTLDFATANNFSLTLPAGGTVSLGNPSNQTAGQSGVVTITQNGTTAALVTYGGNWKFQGGAPSVSTTLSSVNVIAYYVESASRITAQLLTNTVSS